MSAARAPSLVVHGWTVFANRLFLAQIEALAQQVEAFRQKDPSGYAKKNASKRLAAIVKLAFDVIPQEAQAEGQRLQRFAVTNSVLSGGSA